MLGRLMFGNDRPLAQRVQWAAFIMTMFVVLAVVGTLLYVRLAEIPDSELSAHRNAAHVVGEVMAGDIGNRLSKVRDLGQNPLVRAALTSPSLREAYLKPLMLVQEDRSDDVAVQLFDSHGTLVFGELPADAGVPPLGPLAVGVLKTQRAEFSVFSGRKAMILAAYPVLDPSTRDAIGVLVGVVDLSAAFRRRAASLGPELGIDLIHQEQTIASFGADPAERHFPARHEIGTAERIEGTLAVEVYRTSDPWLQPVRSRLTLAGLNAVLMGLVMWVAAGIVARRATQRLDRLAESCAAIADNKAESIPDDPSRDEIGVLTRTLRQAIDAYRQINDNMASLVAEKTRALAESEDRLRSSINAIDEPFAVFDGDDRLVYCNEKYRAAYPGIADRIVAGATFEEIVRAVAERGCANVAAAGAEEWIEEQLQGHRAGGVRIQSATSGRWFRVVERKTSTGDTVGFRVDITELVEAREAAVKASLAKSRFLAMMSHEIRTPMNGVLGMAQLLLQPRLDDAERQDFARTILASGQTLLNLLNDILDLSKVEAGQLTLVFEPVEPEQIVREVRTLFAEAASRKSLHIESAWLGPVGQRYLGDPHRLRQMLSNLISNAIKFTDAGAILIEGREAAREGEAALLEFVVADSGIGVADDKQHLLFQPFSQVGETSSRRFGGTGLGLSIVRNLAWLMGGDAGVESEPGHGSRFWFRIRAGLVAADAAESAAGQSHAEPAQFILPSARFRGTVLVVEDDPTNRKVVEAMLARLGVSARLTENGETAVAEIRRGESPDLVLMDILMPVMDGYEATALIRHWEEEAGHRHIPVVALTASASDEDRLQALAAGMDGFLTKPVNFGQLAGMVGRWLCPADDGVAERGDAEPQDGAAPAAAGAAPAAGALPVFDEPALLRLFGGDRTLAGMVVQSAGENIPGYFDRIEQALAAHERKEARRLAHTAKGLVGQVGGMRLAAGLEAAEKALAGAGEVDVAALRAELAPLLEALRGWRP
jgi:signal transduction histidine kinase/CheY-like chemotaxis protein